MLKVFWEAFFKNRALFFGKGQSNSVLYLRTLEIEDIQNYGASLYSMIATFLLCPRALRFFGKMNKNVGRSAKLHRFRLQFLEVELPVCRHFEN